MTCIVDPIVYPSKKALKWIIDSGENVRIIDPSIANPRVFSATAIKPGEVVFVTNHPKRSWFAQIGRTVDGRLYVK